MPNVKALLFITEDEALKSKLEFSLYESGEGLSTISLFRNIFKSKLCKIENISILKPFMKIT